MALVQKEVKKVYLGTTQVRPAGGGGWQPGANTVAYYPLDSTNTISDLSGNGYDLTSYGVTFGSNYCEVDSGEYLYRNTSNDSMFVTENNPITTSIRIKIIGFNGTSNGYPFWIGQNTNTRVWGFTAQTTKYGIDNRGANQGIQTSMYSNYNDWHLVTFTYGGSGDQYKRIYLDGVEQTSKNQSVNISKSSLYMGKDPVYNAWIHAQVSNFIIENVCWTAQEISDYYDQTKGDYGIS